MVNGRTFALGAIGGAGGSVDLALAGRAVASTGSATEEASQSGIPRSVRGQRPLATSASWPDRGGTPGLPEPRGTSALVYQALDQAAARGAEVARAARLSASATSAALRVLAEHGLAVRGPGGWRRGPSPWPTSPNRPARRTCSASERPGIARTARAGGPGSGHTRALARCPPSSDREVTPINERRRCPAGGLARWSAPLGELRSGRPLGLRKIADLPPLRPRQLLEVFAVVEPLLEVG